MWQFVNLFCIHTTTHIPTTTHHTCTCRSCPRLQLEAQYTFKQPVFGVRPTAPVHRRNLVSSSVPTNTPRIPRVLTCSSAGSTSSSSSSYAARGTQTATYDPRKKVVVVGGGWAGFGAAKHLSEQGYAVTLLEASKNPGGLSGGVCA